MNLKKRIKLSGGLTLLFFIVISIFLSIELEKTKVISEHLQKDELKSNVFSTKLNLGIVNSANSLRGYIITGNDSFNKERLDNWKENILPSIDSLNSLSNNWSLEDKNQLHTIQTKIQLFQTFQEEIFIAKSKGENSAEISRLFSLHLAPIFKEIQAISEELSIKKIEFVSEKLSTVNADIHF